MRNIKLIKDGFLLNKSIRDGALFSIFSFVNKGFAFILLIIIANLMSPADYGYLNLFNTLIMVIGFFIALSSEGYLSVAFFQNGEKGIAQTFSAVFYISLIVSSIFTLFIWIGGNYFAEILRMPYYLLFISVEICFFTLFNNLLLDFFRIKEKIRNYGVFSCCGAIINFLSTIFLIKYCNLGWEGRAIAQACCFSFFGCIGLLYFIRNKYFTTDVRYFIVNVLKWSIPLIPHAATTFLRQGCDRYIIDQYHSISDVGIFGFALTLVNVITMIGFGFNQANSVEIYKVLSNKHLSKEEKLKTLSNQRRTIILIYVIVTILSVIVMNAVVSLLMPKYFSSIKYFIILSLYGFGICIYLLYTNYLFYYKRTKQLMYVTFVSSLIHLILSFLLTRYSLYYTASIYVISQLLVVIFIRMISLELIKKELK